MQPKTRRDASFDIADRLSELELHLEAIPLQQWPELIGRDATEELCKNWCTAILLGMAEGSITVGDPRLADILYKIERSVITTTRDQETAKANFTQLQLKEERDESVTPESFWRAVIGLENITPEAIKAGLTTPGQDLNALPRRASPPSR